MNNIKKLIFNKYIVFCTIFVIINILFLNSMFSLNENLKLSKIYFIVLAISFIIEIIICIGVYYANKKNWKIENIFLIIAIPIGLLYLVLIPVGLVPDEKSHLARSYEVASGYLISEINEDGFGGRNLPIEISDSIANSSDFKYKELLENLNSKDSGELKFQVFTNTSLYSFVSYIPQAIGILIGKILGATVLVTAYLGRLTNFICWLTLIYFSIKKIPFLKKYILFIALLPITMQQAASLSSDSLTISSAILLFSYIMHLTYQRQVKLNYKDYIIVSILSIVISLSKIVYLPLCLLTFLIPSDLFNGKKDKFIKIAILAIIVISINLFWLSIASRFLIEFQDGVNTPLQVKYVLSNPIIYVQTIFNSLVQNGSFYLFTMLGKGLESFNIDLAYIYVFMTLIILSIITNNYRKVNFKINIIDKFIIIFITFSIIMLIFTSLYVQWTPLANKVINGVQGRYFLPILIMLPFMLIPTYKNDNNSKLDKEKNNFNCEKNNYKYLLLFLMFQCIYALNFIFLAHL